MFHINDFLRSEIKKCLVFIFSLLCFFTLNSYAANQRLTQPELPDFSNLVTDNLQIATLKDSIIFFNNNGLWKSDGIAGGTVELIKNFDVNTGLTSWQTFKETPSFVYFSIGDSTGLAIWRTDGTLAGTVKIFDKVLISYFTSTTIGDTLYFFNFTADSKYELWKSEGTVDTTQLVKQLSDSVQFLTAIGNTLYFSCANNGRDDLELWTSNGTALGTKLVKDINTGTASSYVQSITEFNGKAYFFADDGIHGLELWQSDGTEAGTKLVMDINKKADSSILSYIDKNISIVGSSATLKVSNNKLYFFADDGIHGYELWKSDGTEIGTSLVKDIVPGSASAFSYRNTINPYSSAPTLATLNDLIAQNRIRSSALSSRS
jgi:ELWxxDGT repeat protein